MGASVVGWTWVTAEAEWSPLMEMGAATAEATFGEAGDDAWDGVELGGVFAKASGVSIMPQYRHLTAASWICIAQYGQAFICISS